MKKLLFLSIWLFTLVYFVDGQTTKTVGGSGANYANLKLAFAAINSGTITGSITLQITGNITETASAVLNASGSGSASYTSVTIYPTLTGIVLTGNLAAPLIDLNGADNVMIDGRVNATGSTKDLIMINTNTGTSSSTIRFIKSAENNTIKYCTVKGASTNTAGGIIFFSTATSGNGNDGNIIDNCNITRDAAGRPVNAIYSAGTAGRENSAVTISNNYIYDTWRTGSNSSSIQLGSNTTEWNISGNSFYETTALVPTGNYTYNPISIVNVSGNGFVISDNYIGGQAAQCGGSALSINASTTHLFQGIYLSIGNTTTSSVQNNVIQNISFSSGLVNLWYGISINAGSVDIGTIKGNRIGSTTGTGSITITGQITGSNVYGINIASTGVVNCQNNTIGSITVANSNATYASNFYGIYKTGAGTTTISKNTIGSESTSSSILASSTSSSNNQYLIGIYSSGTGAVTLSENQISNIKNACNYSPSSNVFSTVGIETYAGSNTITGNTIYDITCSVYLVVGILQRSTTSGTNQTIAENTIFNLLNVNPSAIGGAYGIYYEGPTSGANSISRNFIHSLDISSTNNSCSMDGIDLISGVVTCSNNIINLGSGITRTYMIYGIWDECVSGQLNNIYFNTVYISGEPSGTTASTYAFYRKGNSGATNLQNNIFFNARSGGSTGKHYAVAIAGIANLIINYNDYYTSGTGGVLGKIGTLEKTTLASWKSGTSQDVNSLSINPVFTNPGSTNAVDYYTSASMPGVSGTGITTDYLNNARAATPKMGALELTGYTWRGTISTDFGTPGNWSGGVVPPDGADISFAENPDRSCVLDQNRTLKNITNAQATDKLVINGKKLTITGNLIFTNGAQINATATSSIAVFAGDSIQNILSGAFVSNTIDGLNINNSNGLTLSGDLTISQELTLANGAFTIGANTLTINGAINITSGTMTGGSSTNIIMGGSSSSTTLPAVVLNNLTINRANGISLGGSVNINGTLVLTNGSLGLGANTLTISGNSPTRTSGNINASNSGATMVFTNSSAITLPASIFSGSVNNLTINGAGGITSNGDFTVNGVLNLQSENPSSIKGSLDMDANTLTMGANATTIGLGDVTGIITRNTIAPNVIYTFGNQYATVIFPLVGTLPTSISVKIRIGVAPSWRSDAVKRIYDLIQTGGSGTQAIMKTHYLDSELNGNDESNLVDWTYVYSYSALIEQGRANFNSIDNWVSIANVDVGLFSSNFGDVEVCIDHSELTSVTWNGTISSEWGESGNWTPSGVPSDNTVVIIPDASTTPNDPDLPFPSICKTINMENGAILNSLTGAQLTITGASGAWSNQGGTFNAGNSNVIFTNPDATINGITNFYNLTINSGAALTLTTGSITRIASSLNNNGILRAAFLPNTIEYNGTDQTIINPNGMTSGYYNLILSGSGTKIMPASDLNISGDFFLNETATATAASILTIGGELEIQSGATFSTGNYNHTVGGHFDNSGTFIPSSGTSITLNGTIVQKIYGETTTTFENLIINNSAGIDVYTVTTINDALTLTQGTLNVGESILNINGTINKTGGYIKVTPLSSLSFGGTEAITLNNNLFLSQSSLANLTINRSGGVTLGNQNMTVNGVLNLETGTLNVNDDTLTIAGNSPLRTSGYIDASIANSCLVFSNAEAITLPASIFAGSVNNLTIKGSGGVTASSDFTVNGILNLQSTNPSDFIGILDMDANILVMGANATTIGLGDVTGIIKRTSFVPNTPYTFGNQFTTMVFADGGTYPSEIQARVSIGTAPSWAPTAIKRVYDIKQAGANNCFAALTYHYLDAELNGNDENKLIHLLNIIAYGGLMEIAGSNHNSTDNWVAVANAFVDYFETNFGDAQSTMIESQIPNYTWNGSIDASWKDPRNWTPNGTPSSSSNVIIPDASTTLNSPTLNNSTEIQSLMIEAAGILNSNPDIQLTINGSNSAWSNFGGTFNANTSNVIFKNADATMSGISNFYNVTIADSAALTPGTDNIMRIAGAITIEGTGILCGALLHNTIEYNGGNQTIIKPNGLTLGYHNLILSGNGTKTLPVSNLPIAGDFTISGTTTSRLTSSMTVNGNLGIANGCQLTLAPTSQMTVMGTLTNDAGSTGLILKSNVDSTASLIHYTPGIEATVERYITGDRWVFLFATLSAIPTTAYTNEGAGKNYNLYSYNETTPDYWNPTYTFGTSGWTAEYVNPGLPTNKGYIYNRYKMSDKVISQNGGTLFTGQKDFQVSYTKNSATIENGVTQGWEYFDGWNLIGNPFASAIDWDLVDKTDIEAGICFFDGNNYRYYISEGGSSPWNTGITLNGGSNIIPSGQGFFVKLKNTGFTHSGVVSIPQNAQLHNEQPFYKSKSVPVDNLLKLNISYGTFSDEAIIRTVPEASESFDSNFDIVKMFSWNKNYPQVFSKNNASNDIYAINTLPVINDYQTIPLCTYAGISGQYTINFINNSFRDYQIWLEDKLLEISQDIRQNPTYTFYLEAGTQTDRFALHFQIDHAPEANAIADQSIYVNDYFDFTLPENTFTDPDSGDVLSLNAKLSDGQALPEWLTFNSSIGRFYGSPVEKQTYQIKVTATDSYGKSVSQAFTLNVNEKSLSIENQEINPINVYPNPSSGLFNIATQGISNSKLSVYNISGKLILERKIVAPVESVNLENAGKGIYLLDIRSGKNIYRRKIEVQ